MSDFLTVGFLPDPGVEPNTSFDPSKNDNIPAIYLTRKYGSDAQLKVQFNQYDPVDTVRYLRKLAEVATDLADRVEQAARADRGIEP
ncbi:hypothetical protein ABZX12_18465 [Kribbella sp. NPDC003505]|uniref:hypothetical protein n=1 Tax=Kribbella sp. NPDC003505 TaxID=3154448 RepID=UPI0033BD3FC6